MEEPGHVGGGDFHECIRDSCGGSIAGTATVKPLHRTRVYGRRKVAFRFLVPRRGLTTLAATRVNTANMPDISPSVVLAQWLM